MGVFTLISIMITELARMTNDTEVMRPEHGKLAVLTGVVSRWLDSSTHIYSYHCHQNQLQRLDLYKTQAASHQNMFGPV